MRIAYQGVSGSHGEFAADVLARRLPGGPHVLMPQLSAHAALRSLDQHAVDYACLAVSNTVDTRIEETFLALGTMDLELVDEETVPVGYSLFARAGEEGSMPAQLLLTGSSRKQCQAYLSSHPTGAHWSDVLDGAQALWDLAEGKFGGVVTRVIAPTRMEGMFPTTVVLASGIQDRSDNATTYGLYRRA